MAFNDMERKVESEVTLQQNMDFTVPISVIATVRSTFHSCTIVHRLQAPSDTRRPGDTPGDMPGGTRGPREGHPGTWACTIG